MELREVMRSTPATRRFLADPIPRETLVRVLDDARFAPSGGNRQGWRVVAVEDPHRRETLRDLYLPPWRAYMERTGGAALLADPEAADPAVLQRVRAANEFAERLHEVPLHLVVWVRLADLAITDAQLDRPSVVGGASVYPFVQNVLLRLRDEGLGASLTTLLVPAEAEVRQLLVVPDEFALAAYLAVGRRDGPWPKQLSRHPVHDFAFLERFGEPLTSD
jgi:nitroreductase